MNPYLAMLLGYALGISTLLVVLAIWILQTSAVDDGKRDTWTDPLEPGEFE